MALPYVYPEDYYKKRLRMGAMDVHRLIDQSAMLAREFNVEPSQAVDLDTLSELVDSMFALCVPVVFSDVDGDDEDVEQQAAGRIHHGERIGKALAVITTKAYAASGSRMFASAMGAQAHDIAVAHAGVYAVALCVPEFVDNQGAGDIREMVADDIRKEVLRSKSVCRWGQKFEGIRQYDGGKADREAVDDLLNGLAGPGEEPGHD